MGAITSAFYGIGGEGSPLVGIGLMVVLGGLIAVAFVAYRVELLFRKRRT